MLHHHYHAQLPPVSYTTIITGAHNTIVTSRAGKDLVSSLVAGLLTIGPRFGGAIDDAARYFKDAYHKVRVYIGVCVYWCVCVSVCVYIGVCIESRHIVCSV